MAAYANELGYLCTYIHDSGEIETISIQKYKTLDSLSALI